MSLIKLNYLLFARKDVILQIASCLEKLIF